MIQSPAGYQGDVRIKRYLDYYQPRYGVMMLSAGQVAAFSPASLFASGEQGVWYDPSDMTTLFQDAAGTTPVTAVEQPVGRILDKSGRGNHATQSTSTSRPVLSARVNLFLNSATLSTQNVTTVATNYTLRFEGAGSVTLSGTGSGTYNAGTHTVTCTAGTLTVTVTGSVSNADIRVANIGVSLPAYQAITTATSYDTTGFPMYLRFDGADDNLVMPLAISTLNLNIWAGARETGNANTNARVMIIGDSVAQTNNLGLVLNGATPANSGVGYRFPENAPVNLGMTINSSVVVSYQRSSTTLQSARLNGTNLPNNTATTTTFTSATGNVGWAVNAPTYFIGNLYSLIIRGASSTATEIAQTETWVNGKTYAY